MSKGLLSIVHYCEDVRKSDIFISSMLEQTKKLNGCRSISSGVQKLWTGNYIQIPLSLTLDLVAIAVGRRRLCPLPLRPPPAKRRSPSPRRCLTPSSSRGNSRLFPMILRCEFEFSEF